jgi:dsRNA-specific ribonuclease
MEAVFGAVFLDGGLAAAVKAIHPMLGELDEPAEGRSPVGGTDSKTRLQELVQALGRELPEYRLVEAVGPDHSKVFTVECWLSGEASGKGVGPSKKIAEQQAAADALERLSAAEQELPA